MDLRRIKALATAVLVGCFAVYVAARWGELSGIGWLGPVRAFAEAATIGGLADWYAVVVLFRHPMGVKLPHTAIIPANQERIADNMGVFLERNFLKPHMIEERLRDIDFAHHMADFLQNEEQAREAARFAVKLVPDVLAAIEDSGFRDFAAEKIADQVQRTKIAPVATKLIDSFVQDGRYQVLLDEIIDALDKLIHDEDTLKSIQKRVADELPAVLYVFQADTAIIRRIAKVSTQLLADVKEDPDHPMRAEFQELFENYVERMKQSRRFGRRVERFKQEILARPELAELADRIWDNLVAYVNRDAARENPVLARELTKMMAGLGRQLRRDPALCARINDGLVETLTRTVVSQREQVSDFVSNQVRGWDIRQLVRLIEANVGRDLQYIRFNGMLIGGLAGLTLYTVELLIVG
ncbi:MAG: DUF445 family protein [Pseudomonadota bacterium]